MMWGILLIIQIGGNCVFSLKCHKSLIALYVHFIYFLPSSIQTIPGCQIFHLVDKYVVKGREMPSRIDCVMLIQPSVDLNASVQNALGYHQVLKYEKKIIRKGNNKKFFNSSRIFVRVACASHTWNGYNIFSVTLLISPSIPCIVNLEASVHM